MRTAGARSKYRHDRRPTETEEVDLDIYRPQSDWIAVTDLIEWIIDEGNISATDLIPFSCRNKQCRYGGMAS